MTHIYILYNHLFYLNWNEYKKKKIGLCFDLLSILVSKNEIEIL